MESPDRQSLRASTRGDTRSKTAVKPSLPGDAILRAYRYALDPTPAQEAALRSHCGAQRRAFNWGLALVKANLDQRSAERTYDIAENELTPPLDWSAYALRKRWNQVKDDIAPWWRDNSKEAYASGLANLAAALSNWSASRAGERRGPRTRFPRFKSKRAALSCRFTTGALGLTEADRRHVKLPRIGIVRTHESTRKLARRLTAGTARIRSATVTFKGGRWFAAISVEVRRTSTAHRRPTAVVGLDLGVRHIAVLSHPVDGVTDEHGMIANPKHLDAVEAKLRRLQRRSARRRGPNKLTGQVPSKRWHRTRAQVARLHARVGDARRDSLHQLTTALTSRFTTIVIEDLHVAGMLRNHRMARRIADAGWGELRRQLEYKTNWRATELKIADRWYPSSKTCSRCGTVKAKLRLSERIFHCEECGHSSDRDINAAMNLAKLASAIACHTSSSSCGATQNEPAGNPGKTSRTGDGYRHGKPHRGNVA